MTKKLGLLVAMLTVAAAAITTPPAKAAACPEGQHPSYYCCAYHAPSDCDVMCYRCLPGAAPDEPDVKLY